MFFHGKDVIQVSSNAKYIFANSNSTNLASVVHNSSTYDASILDELDAITRGGEFLNTDAFYAQGKSGNWKNGLTEVSFSSGIRKDSFFPLELKDLIETYEPNLYEILSLEIKYPTGIEETLKINPNQYNLDNGQNPYNLDGVGLRDDVGMKPNILRRYLNNLSAGEITETINNTSNYHINILGNTYNVPKPAEGLYYVVWIRRVEENGDISNSIVNTVIIPYDKNLYPYLEVFKLQTKLSDFTGFPVVALMENKDLLSIYKYQSWKSMEGSNKGHTVYPMHMRRDILKSLSEEDRKNHIARRVMLETVGIDEDSFVDNYMNLVKYPTETLIDNSEARRAEFKTHLDTWNSENGYELTIEEALSWYSLQSMHIKKASCFEVPDNVDIQEPPLSQEKIDRYLKFNRDAKEYLDGLYFSDEMVQLINLTNYYDIEDGANNLNSMFITYSIDLDSDNQTILKAIFLTFKIYESYFRDILESTFSGVHGVQYNMDRAIEYIEDSYNKKISFGDIEISTTSIIDESEMPSEWNGNVKKRNYNIYYQKDIVDKKYTITKYERVVENGSYKKKFNKTYIYINDLKFESIIEENGISKGSTHQVNGEAIGLPMPLLREVWINMTPFDKIKLSKECICLESYSSSITHLKWYETKSFTRFIVFLTYAYDIFTLGATSGGTELVREAIKQAAIKWLEKKILDWAIEEFIDDEEMKALVLTLYAVYNISKGGSSGDEFKDVISITNAISKSIQIYQAEELKALERDRDSHNKEQREALKELRDKIKSYGDSPLILPTAIEVPETPGKYYKRTLSYPLNLDLSLDLELKHFD